MFRGAGYEELAKGFDRLDCPARNSPLASGPPTVRQAPGLFTILLLGKREGERENDLVTVSLDPIGTFQLTLN